MENQTEIRIHELVFKSVEGIITEPECRELETIVANNIQARDIYSKCIKLNMKMLSLREKFSGSSDLSMIVHDSSDIHSRGDSIDICNEILDVLSEKENTAPAVDIIEEPKKPVIEKVTVKQVESKPHLFYRVYNALVTIAAVFMFLFIVYANIFPPQYTEPVATVTDQLNVSWDKNSKKLNIDERIMTNHPPYIIEKGIIRISYDQGVEVLIEGPAEFEIERAGIFLEYGKLFSSVSETGQGFSVDSHFTRLVDLGTEFGVEIDRKGSSQLHVIDGKVQFYAGIIGEDKVSKTIHEYNAVSFDSTSGNVSSIPFKKDDFVRQICSDTGIIWRGQNRIDLADIAGGGNGFGTGMLDYGINHKGEICRLNQINVQNKIKEFIQISDNQFIDGIFVPNGPTKIDSTNTIFSNFESTNNRFYMGILNGAWHQHTDDSVPRHALRLDGTECGTLEKPAIYIHANQGITYDLDAIRKYTKMNIVRFVSNCGLSESYGDYTDDILKVRKKLIEKPKASFYVLVDGQEKFLRKDATYLDGTVEISVDISPDNRFLTLATTQGSDNGNDGDWTLFAEPALELAK